MSKTLSVTVDTDDYNALTRASDMLHGLAVDLQKQTAGSYPDAKPQPVAAAEAEVQSGPQFVAHLEDVDIFTNTEITLAEHGQLTREQQEAHTGRVIANPEPREQNNEGDTIGGDCAQSLNGAVFAENPVDPNVGGASVPAAAAPLATASTPAPAATVTASTPTTAPAAASPSASATAPAAAQPASVQLADGIPWDHRIHGSGKKTLAKAPQGWKLKRKPADMDAAQWDAYVLEVEAELRAAMAVPAAVPNVAAAPTAAASAPATAPASLATPATTPTPPPAAAPTAAPAPAASPAAITTMAQLMPAVTAAGITQEQLLAAVQGVGLQSIPLLGARPDLIAGVVTALGLGV